MDLLIFLKRFEPIFVKSKEMDKKMHDLVKRGPVENNHSISVILLRYTFLNDIYTWNDWL